MYGDRLFDLRMCFSWATSFHVLVELALLGQQVLRRLGRAGHEAKFNLPLVTINAGCARTYVGKTACTG